MTDFGIKFFSAVLAMTLLSGYSATGSAKATKEAPLRVKDVSGRTFCNDSGLKFSFHRDGRIETNSVGNGTWSVDEFNHVIMDFPTQHMDIAATKERTPQGMVFHYHRWGGDESVGDAKYCD